MNCKRRGGRGERHQVEKLSNGSYVSEASFLVASGQTGDESFLGEALTHFSQFNEKHQKTCPAWELHNNKSQARRKYCIQPQRANGV